MIQDFPISPNSYFSYRKGKPITFIYVQPSSGNLAVFKFPFRVGNLQSCLGIELLYPPTTAPTHSLTSTPISVVQRSMEMFGGVIVIIGPTVNCMEMENDCYTFCLCIQLTKFANSFRLPSIGQLHLIIRFTFHGQLGNEKKNSSKCFLIHN